MCKEEGALCLFCLLWSLKIHYRPRGTFSLIVYECACGTGALFSTFLLIFS